MARKIEVIEKAEIFDDYDGHPLDPDTKPKRYAFGGNAYDLYLSPENTATVDKFIADLIDGADKVKAGQGTGGVSETEKQRRAAVVKEYNKANPGQNAARYSKTVQAWERSK